MRTWFISDTHGYHDGLRVPEAVDCVVFCGDATNAFEIAEAEREFGPFLTWFGGLAIRRKVLVAGNHDAWALRQNNLDALRAAGVTYLQDEAAEVGGVRFYGSPWTPTFGTWRFMKSRDKLSEIWNRIPDDCEVLVTHGPPLGILDLADTRAGQAGQVVTVGDRALRRHVLGRVRPRVHAFGHVHDSRSGRCLNHGLRVVDDTRFVNASCVTDGRWDEGVTSQGLVLEV